MTAPDPPAVEFSRPVSTMRLGRDETVYELTANAGERVALARRFDLVSLDDLIATVRLTRQAGEIRVTAELVADVTLLCGVTLEPFASRVTDRSTVLYRRDAPPGDLAADDEVYELVADDTIDLGEAVAQQLSLALPPFPRAPGATIPAAEIPAFVQLTADGSIAARPFAELAKSAKK
jgi:uncharacterized metal-binding protein YceD (DUF177 family)